MVIKKLGLLVGLSYIALSLGCAKKDDPSAIDVANLKFPNALRVIDQGDYTVALQWRASNFEHSLQDDFEGYNVYGIKITDEKLAELGLTKGQPIQLLDEEGDAKEEAKKVLQEFNFNPEDPLNSKKDTVTEDGEKKFSYLPIHQLDGDTPLLPTCYPETAVPDSSTGVIKCASTAKDSNLDDRTANGIVQYTVPFKLTAGDQYCFLVFSVMDGGKHISQMSSNLECIRPKIEKATSLALNGTSREFKIRDYLKACLANENGCSSVSESDYAATSGGSATDTSTGALYLEFFNNTAQFTAGANCGILDYGYRPSGFNDPEIPSFAPSFGNEYATNKLFNKNGYSLAGQSISIRGKNVYVLACTDTEDSSKVFYHWIYTSDTTAPATNTSSFNVTFRLSAKSY